MSEYYTLEQIDEVARFIRSRIEYKPGTAIILGSGLGELARSVKNPVVFPYETLPNWPVATVVGHKGSLVIGKMEDQPVVVMQGRVHYYEGYSMAQITLPVRVFKRLGVNNLFVTNAAGAVNPEFDPG
jgi:purine-nucleoside phosphorylase